MTPTLFGRWQTRILLFGTVGLLVTLLFCIGIFGNPGFRYLAVLFWVGILGLGWDLVYDFLQKWRWDRDWPAVFQLFAGIWEGLFIFLVINVFQIPLLGIEDPLDFGLFFFHYSTVWLSIFIVSQSLMRIIFPRWRFCGGKWL